MIVDFSKTLFICVLKYAYLLLLRSQMFFAALKISLWVVNY